MDRVSVIIPTSNGEQSIGPLLSALVKQTLKPDQVLIVDSSSNDNTLRICEGFDVEIIRINAGSFDHGGTRNLAASKAAGDILIYMTQDALLKDSKCLENLVRPLADPQVAASYARQVARDDANPIERFARSFNYPPGNILKGVEDLNVLGIKTFFFSNTCSAIKRSVFEKAGGFPDKTITNEDMFLAAKLVQRGHKIAYQADAVVYHSHNYTISSVFKRYFDIGVFFNRNPWIAGLARSEREGTEYLRKLLSFLITNKRWRWIPYALIETATRFIGYRIGLSEGLLPIWGRKRLSNNKGFWTGYITGGTGTHL